MTLSSLASANNFFSMAFQPLKRVKPLGIGQIEATVPGFKLAECRAASLRPSSPLPASCEKRASPTNFSIARRGMTIDLRRSATAIDPEGWPAAHLPAANIKIASHTTDVMLNQWLAII
jgi:hypothetical protein